MDLIGRVLELGVINATVDRAPGTAPNLVLDGDPGVGKTALLQAASTTPSASGTG